MVDTLYRHKTRFTDHTPFQFRWRITQLHSQYSHVFAETEEKAMQAIDMALFRKAE